MISVISLLAGLYLFGHAVRDLLQYLGVENWFTQFAHLSGINSTNHVLAWFGLSYQLKQELAYFIVELLISLLLFTVSWRLSKK